VLVLLIAVLLVALLAIAVAAAALGAWLISRRADKDRRGR